MASGRKNITGTKAAGGENPLPLLFQSVGLVQRLMQPYFLELGISWSQWGVLRTLDKAEATKETLRLSELGERLLIQPPSVSTVVDRLEKQGFLSRTPSSDDRRARELSLTDKGRMLVKAVMKQHPARLEKLLSGLSEKERESLVGILKKLNTHIESLL